MWANRETKELYAALTGRVLLCFRWPRFHDTHATGVRTCDRASSPQGVSRGFLGVGENACNFGVQLRR